MMEAEEEEEITAARLALEAQDRGQSCSLVRVLVTIAAIVGFVLVLQAVIRADQAEYAAIIDGD